jgi:hypothetical protein
MSGTECRPALCQQGVGSMNAIDRVMRAYSNTHKLTDAQYEQVRVELSAFIRELAFGKPLAADGTQKVSKGT